MPFKAKENPTSREVMRRPWLPGDTFVFNELHLIAAAHFASGKRVTEVARLVGMSHSAIGKWKQIPPFCEKIAEYVAEFEKLELGAHFAHKHVRIIYLNQIAERILDLIDARARSNDFWKAELKKVKSELEDSEETEEKERLQKLVDILQNRICSGSETGLLARDVKAADGSVHDIYRADVGLMKEFRETLKQIAQERGQWTEKQDVTSGGKPMVVKISAIMPGAIVEDEPDDDPEP